MTPPRRGRPRSEYRDRVVRLYRRGQRPTDIARTLNLTRQWVSIILKEAGVDAVSEAQRLQNDADARFQATWEAAPDSASAARMLGLTRARPRLGLPDFVAEVYCSNVFRGPSRPSKAPAILELHRKGFTAKEIIRRGVASRKRVYEVLEQLKPPGSNDGRVWTAKEDAMLGTMSDAQVAARTGRKARAVADRRRLLRRRGA